jgi:hypothetical protein
MPKKKRQPKNLKQEMETLPPARKKRSATPPKPNGHWRQGTPTAALAEGTETLEAWDQLFFLPLSSPLIPVHVLDCVMQLIDLIE